MNQIYIFNDNASEAFMSILMNDLNNRGLMFNNIKSTKTIYYNNLLVYIPRVCSENHIDDFIRNNRNNIFRFKKILVVCNNMNDYDKVKKVHISTLSRVKIRHYCGLAFDTLLSRIVADDCNRIISSSV